MLEKLSRATKTSRSHPEYDETVEFQFHTINQLQLTFILLRLTLLLIECHLWPVPHLHASLRVLGHENGGLEH